MKSKKVFLAKAFALLLVFHTSASLAQSNEKTFTVDSEFELRSVYNVGNASSWCRSTLERAQQEADRKGFRVVKVEACEDKGNNEYVRFIGKITYLEH